MDQTQILYTERYRGYERLTISAQLLFSNILHLQRTQKGYGVEYDKAAFKDLLNCGGKAMKVYMQELEKARLIEIRDYEDSPSRIFINRAAKI